MGLRDFFKKKRREKFGAGAPSAESVLSDSEIAANWAICKSCSTTIHKSEFAKELNVCPKCGFHGRVSTTDRIKQLIDEDTFKEIDHGLSPEDPLKFSDDKAYLDRVESAQKKTEVNEAVTCGTGKIEGIGVSIAIMNFDFIGGSMGSVVGEKITRAIEKAIELKVPFIALSSSGGARMHEGILSLMQMAKTSAALAELEEAKLLYISLLTDPTYGGVAASFSTLGDLQIAEPRARIGFAGKRVIEETIREKLPKDFQTAEYLLEHGQIDMIVHRKDMKAKLAKILKIHGYSDLKTKPKKTAKKTDKKVAA